MPGPLAFLDGVARNATRREAGDPVLAVGPARERENGSKLSRGCGAIQYGFNGEVVDINRAKAATAGSAA